MLTEHHTPESSSPISVFLDRFKRVLARSAGCRSALQPKRNLRWMSTALQSREEGREEL